jgi:hypothetical protein
MSYSQTNHSDVLLLGMVALHTHILEDHGGPLEGSFLHSHGWMPALNQLGGITGTSVRTSEVPVFMSIGIFSFYLFFFLECEYGLMYLY